MRKSRNKGGREKEKKEGRKGGDGRRVKRNGGLEAGRKGKEN